MQADSKSTILDSTMKFPNDHSFSLSSTRRSQFGWVTSLYKKMQFDIVSFALFREVEMVCVVHLVGSSFDVEMG